METIRKILLTALTAVLLLAGGGRAAASGPGGGMDVTVESYNILGKVHAHKSPWEPRRQYVGELILQEDNFPDILGVQECTDPSQHGDLIGMLCAEYDWVIGGPAMSARAIFWKRGRFELVESYAVDMLDRDKYPEKHVSSRYALHARLREKETGREILVYNIHVKAGSSEENVALRKECVDALCPAAMKRSEELGGLPVIVTGDMNNHPATSPHGIPGSPLVFAGYGFRDSFTMTENRINQDYNTYNTQQNVDDCTVSADGPGGSKRIDYIFCWPAERFSSSEHAIVINFRDGSGVNAQCPLPSDHNPVRSRLTINYD